MLLYKLIITQKNNFVNKNGRGITPPGCSENGEDDREVLTVAVVWLVRGISNLTQKSNLQSF